MISGAAKNDRAWVFFIAAKAFISIVRYAGVALPISPSEACPDDCFGLISAGDEGIPNRDKMPIAAGCCLFDSGGAIMLVH